ncbi:MAG: flagellar biosynthetic protein FliO [Pseudomonadota bacterium]|uniref:flagellar biosynthetic protein FliO n=1 Tax=Methyloversatilis sp. TaxID=2569862 RepID=UPI002733A2F1|nr:flagellar biosynthetic protein FliO [Methyloversatilis sp.]MDP3871081.1 flagellar biosynthetic protein FliO [Methyloversatilis sp.]
MKIWLSLLLLFSAGLLQAAEPAAPASPASGAGAVMQMVGALGVVLATLFAVLWLLRRLSGGRLTGSSAPIRTVGGIAVGSRERVVLLEIGEHWLVVGVAPGSVTGIATLPRGEISPAGSDAKPVAADFGALLAKLKAGRS